MVNGGVRTGRASAGGIPIGILIAALFLAQCLAPLPAAGARAPDTKTIERMEVRFTSPARAAFNASLTIHEYFDGSQRVPADVLRERVTSAGQEAFRAELENYTARTFRDTVSGILPGDAFDPGRCVFENSSLVDLPGTDEYNPPVVMNSAGELAIGPVSLGLPATADLDKLIPLLLSDGVRLRRNVLLDPSPGALVEVSVQSFPGTIFEESDGPRLELTVDNSIGASGRSKNFTLTLRLPISIAPVEEMVHVRGTIDIPDLDNLTVRGTAEFLRADPRGYWTPPASVLNLTTVSGRTLSELVSSGIIPAVQIYSFGIRPMQLELEEQLGSLFNVSLSFGNSWDTAGNLSCTLAAFSSGHALFALEPDIVRGMLNAGAEYRFSVPLDFGWPTRLELVPPEGMVLKGLEPAGPAPSGRTLYTYTSNGTGIIQAALASAHPAPLSEDIRIEVITDFDRPSPQLGRLIWTQDTDVPVHIDARFMMGTAAVPSGIAAMIPANLSLQYVTSDLLRLLLDKGIIGEVEMSSILIELRPRMEAPMRAALGAAVRPTLRFVPVSLQGYDIDGMDGSRPVVIEAWAKGTRVKHLDLFKAVLASPGLMKISQDFALGGVSGANVTYRMRFAPELVLVSVDGHGARVTRGTDGGRDFFEVSFGRAGGHANVTAYLEPAPGFLLVSMGPQLSPCLALFIVIVLVFLVRFRKRQKNRKARLILRKHD